MTTPIISMGSYGGDTDRLIEQIKWQDALHKELGSAISDFLQAAFPQAKEEASNLGFAYVRLMTAGTNDQITMLQERKAQYEASNHGDPYAYLPPPTMETLVQLTKQRDAIQSQMDGANKLANDMDAKSEGSGNMLRAQIQMMGLDTALTSIEERISEVQKRLEAQTA